MDTGSDATDATGNGVKQDGAATDADGAVWLPLGWPDGCDVEYATDPIAAFPKQNWVDCGSSGCLKLDVSFPYDDFEPFKEVQASGNGSDIRFGFAYVRSKSAAWEFRWVALSRDGTPLVVERWHKCLPDYALSNSALCMRVTALPNPSPTATFPWASAPKIASQQFVFSGSERIWCTDDLVTSLDEAGNPCIYDLAANAQFQILPPNGQGFDPRLHGAYAPFMRWGVEGGQEVLDGWLWQRPNQIAKLVDPGTQKVFDIRTDGTRLVWVQVNAPDISEAYAGDLWTSPFATSAAGLKPIKLRAIPPTTIFNGNYAVGGGFYSIVEGSLSTTNTQLHVYRLSDGHHWLVPPPPGLINSTLVQVDDQEVWYLGRLPNGLTRTIVRQRLDALGPGD